MNVHARVRGGVLGLVVCGSVACIKTAPTGRSTVAGEEPMGLAPPAAGDAMKDAGAVASGNGPAEAETDVPDSTEPMSAEVEWVESPVQVDLDGDGMPESITWSCGGTLRVAVGRARASEPYQVVEEMSCSAGVVQLRPDEPHRQLVIVIDEHDEVGPDLHIIYAYRDEKLERVWSEAARVDFLVDGSWVTETTDCRESSGYLATFTGRHRWNGSTVTSQEDEARAPIEPGDCAEP